MIEFYKYEEKSELLDPNCDFKKTSQVIEHRKEVVEEHQNKRATEGQTDVNKVLLKHRNCYVPL